jgi:hypothetical protein
MRHFVTHQPEKRQYNAAGMSTSNILFLAAVVFAIGALLSLWTGIRYIQSARTVVFYRTRRARMLAGWQLLAVGLALASFAVASILFGEPLVRQILSLTSVPTHTGGVKIIV